jgi:glycosyltransferase involved in cell wall biosynthesis
MRVALVSPGYPTTLGGVEMVVAQTARALVRAGAQVDVLAEERCPELPRLSEDAGVVVRRFACNGADNFRLAPGLLRYLAAHRDDYDVMHAHSYHAPVAVSAALALRAGRMRAHEGATVAPRAGGAFGRPTRATEGPARVVSPHYHGCGHSRLRTALHRLYKPLGRHALGLADRVVCVSRAEAELVERHFPGTAGRLAMIPNGVDASAIRAARPFPDEPPTVLAVGRLESYKRLDLVIEAFARWAGASGSGLSGTDQQAQLVIVGAGPDGARLEGIADRTGLGARVRMLSGLSDGSLHRWLHTASVLCSMSEHEAYGLAPAEALVADTPVVLSAIPAHRELAGVAGAGAVTLVEPDAAALAHALGSLLASGPGPRRALGGGLLAGDILGWDDVAANLSALYRAAIGAELYGLSW